MALKLARHGAAACAATALLLVACAHGGAAAPPPPPQVATGTSPSGQRANPDAQTLATMQKRLDEYVALHKKLEDTLPKLPKEATPQQIDQNQRALGKLIQEARKDAKPGEIFTPEAHAVIHKLMESVFGGPDGRQLRDSIMDENPGKLAITVNSRYPDSVPLSTVPPQVLAGLPKLPEEMEFRFIGRRLILMDVHAHLIVDFIDNAIPA